MDKRFLLVLPVTLALACASSPVPTGQVARAKSALEQAESAGAAEHAALEMRTAREKLDRAEKLMAEHDEDGARDAAEQAEVDALLAAAKARRAKAETSVKELQETMGAMQEEMSHGTR